MHLPHLYSIWPPLTVQGVGLEMQISLVTLPDTQGDVLGIEVLYPGWGSLIHQLLNQAKAVWGPAKSLTASELTCSWAHHLGLLPFWLDISILTPRHVRELGQERP